MLNANYNAILDGPMNGYPWRCNADRINIFNPLSALSTFFKEGVFITPCFCSYSVFFLFFLVYFFGFVSYLTFTLTSYTIKNWVFGVGLFSGLFSNKIFKFILFPRLSTKPASTSLMQGWLCLVLQGLHWLIDQT